ncbi:hypothetical protein ACFSM5_07390 [Lacibacterium aquatile]|uniref:Class I SAM-dependent methyltransferase n=1 Tax=Lacibacterium aquatile TaxID=1168082 RepID=A0ABW5DNW7_9PROT
MGIVNFGAPTALIERLQQRVGFEVFFETGTFRGQTTIWAADRFPRVITVELSESCYNQSIANIGDRPTVTALLGDSRGVMEELVDTLPPTLFWLDAHYCTFDTAGEFDQCPLIKELELIAPYADQHFILIDDARLFLDFPLPPNDYKQWPDMGEIMRAISTHHPMSVYINDDVMYIFATSKRDLMAEVLCEHILSKPEAQWQEEANRVTGFNIRQNQFVQQHITSQKTNG